MKCDAYRILIREMLQGRLEIDEATLVAGHLDACEACRSFHRDLLVASPAQQEPAAATAGPSAPTGGPAQDWPAAAAVVLVVLVLGGLAILAVHGHGGWTEHSVGRSAHHEAVQDRSR